MVSNAILIFFVIVIPTVLGGILIYSMSQMQKMLKMTMYVLNNDEVRRLINSKSKINRPNTLAFDVEDVMTLRGDLYIMMVAEYGHKNIELRKFFFEEGNNNKHAMIGFCSILERITGKKILVLQ